MFYFIEKKEELKNFLKNYVMEESQGWYHDPVWTINEDDEEVLQITTKNGDVDTVTIPSLVEEILYRADLEAKYKIPLMHD